ncbi:TlpA family protein disulfide reductase [Natrinema marinum]|uniref:TlpA family protein disulfide reductase n=1 Tax=Natrinema marinum TaxID=2961598 RepID=UPI0020C86D3A|nr:TlpA disulfide reductase family protein [Natrinema marinum]
MRRRELLAGLGGAGIVAGAGALAATGGNLDTGGSGDGSDADGSSGLVGKQFDPLEIETVDARGSEAGTVQVPAPGQPTFVDFFATWCTPCEKQMDALADAHARVSDDVVFLSVTNEPFGRSIDASELSTWWREHDGNWTIGLDPTAKLTSRYWASQYPVAVAVDASGTLRWRETGIKTADELVAGIEQAVAAGGE